MPQALGERPASRPELSIGLAPSAAHVQDLASSQAACAPVLWRFTAYTLILAVTVASLLRLLLIHDSIEQRVFQEGGIVERGQFIAALLISALLALAGWRWRGSAPVLLPLSAIAFIAPIRELDSWLDDLIPILGWKLPAGMTLAVGAWFVIRHADRFWSQAARWVHTPAFGVLWSGFMVVAVFAQLMGQVELWEGIMGDRYERAFKRTVEESAEMFGYMLLLIGSIEATWQASVFHRSGRASAGT